MPIAACVDRSGALRAGEELRLVGDDAAIRAEPVAPSEFAFRADDSIIAAELEGLSLVADARLDNLEDLRRELQRPGDESVGALILHGYRRWHDGVVERLLGDFAFVLWDAGRRRVVAARDPFGVRPLFYVARGPHTWFASQLSDLRRTLGGTLVLDDERIVEHLLWRYRSISATCFRDIRELPAGHVLTSSSAEPRLARYWFPPEPRSELARRGRDDLFEELRSLFRTAVRRRVRSPSPVVVHVSGGLDSSSIAMIADELGPEQGGPPAFVGTGDVFPGLPCDESAYIDAVARAVHYRIERHDGRQSAPVDLTAPAFDAPGARMITTWGTDGDMQVAKAAGARVILAGLGGDDLMMATGFTRDLIVAGHWREAWSSLRAEGISLKAAVRVKGIAAQFLPVKVRGFRARQAATPPAWLAPRFHELARDITAAGAAEQGLVDARLGTLVRSQAWRRLNAPHNRRSIAAMQGKAGPLGVEYRFPFLDRDLIRFVLSLPPHCLPGPVRYARIHREAFRPFLPSAIADRSWKAEMSPALRERSERAQPVIEDLLTQGDWMSARYVDRTAAGRFLRTVAGAPVGTAAITPIDRWRLWNVAAVEAWMRGLLMYGIPQ